MEGKPTLRLTVIDTRKEFLADRQQLRLIAISPDVRGQENVKVVMICTQPAT